jgi:glycerophosphoryl diester phosphodiesterase
MRPSFDRPLGFAHRGARAHAPENTIEAFVTALRMGATALETDVWVTRDGVVVVDHDGKASIAGRRVPIAAVDRRALPPHVPSLDEVQQAVGTAFDLSIDLKDEAAVGEVLRIRGAGGPDTLRKTWLCHPDPRVLADWRSLSDDVRIVASTKRRHLVRRAGSTPTDLAEIGVDVVNLRGDTWTRELIRRCHEAELLAFAWNVQRRRHMRRLLAWGIDGIFSDHTDRLVGVLDEWQRVEVRPS